MGWFSSSSKVRVGDRVRSKVSHGYARRGAQGTVVEIDPSRDNMDKVNRVRGNWMGNPPIRVRMDNGHVYYFEYGECDVV